MLIILMSAFSSWLTYLYSRYHRNLRTTDILASQRTAELEKVNRELTLAILERERLNEHLRDAKEAAESATHAKSDFLANMSHEIRTPLNAVLGFSDLLIDTPLNPQQKEFVETIRIAGDNLLVVINDILDLSKIESGKMELESIPFSPHDTLRAVIQMSETRAKQKGLTLRSSLPENLPRWMEGDPIRLRQILLNFINNATKFTDRGFILVEIHQLPHKDLDKQEWIRFDVTDTGIGMSTEVIQKLFRPFTQADMSTTRRFGGTGLGLSICKRLVEMMGGNLGVESEEGKGSTFWFEIPLKLAEEPDALPTITMLGEDISTLPMSHIPSSTQPIEMTAKQVLLVEDNPINQKIALIMLTKLGIQADVAHDGEQAVNSSLEKNYDVILMDCQMPIMDGFAATQAIRNNDDNINQRTPIIALTANAFENDKQRCLGAGMDDFLSKPVTLDNLRDKIEAWTT